MVRFWRQADRNIDRGYMPANRRHRGTLPSARLHSFLAVIAKNEVAQRPIFGPVPSFRDAQIWSALAVGGLSCFLCHNVGYATTDARGNLKDLLCRIQGSFRGG